MQQSILVSQSSNSGLRLTAETDVAAETSWDDADAFAGLFEASELTIEDAEEALPKKVKVEDAKVPLGEPKIESPELSSDEEQDSPLVDAIVDPKPPMLEGRELVQTQLPNDRRLLPVVTPVALVDRADLKTRTSVSNLMSAPRDVPAIEATGVLDTPAQVPTKNQASAQPQHIGSPTFQPLQHTQPVDKRLIPERQSKPIEDASKPQVPSGSQEVMSAREIAVTSSFNPQTLSISTKTMEPKAVEFLGQLTVDKEHSLFAVSNPVSIDQPTAARGFTAPSQPTATPLQITQQVVAAIAQSGGGSIEITLNPEELGRVRVQLTPSDTGTFVVLQSERPDVLDVLRRHIDLLAQDLGDAGFENLEFDFSGFDNDNEREGQDADGSTDGQPQATLVTTNYRINLSDTGLDLRL